MQQSRIGYAILLILASTVAIPAYAQPEATPPPPNEDDGEDHTMRTEGLNDEAGRSAFRVGQTLFQEGRFVEAGREFERAFELSQRASLLYNAYLAYRDGGQLGDAARCLEGYLDANPEVADAERLGHRLAAMRNTLAEQERAAAATEEERARLAAEREAEQAAAAAEQERLRLEAEEQRRRAESAETALNPIGYAVGGAGLALLGGALAMGLVANSRVGSLEDNCPDDRCIPSFDLAGERDKTDRAIVVTDVLLFTGIATLAVGVVLLFVGRGSGDDEAPAATAGAMCTGEGCAFSVQGNF